MKASSYFSLPILLATAIAQPAYAEGNTPAPSEESPALLTSLQRLQASLAIPTISDRLNEAATQEAFAQHRTLLTTAYPQTFQTLKTHDVGPYSILLEWPGQNQDLKGSLLMAHQDVVPVDDSDTWQHPPFSGVEADGFIWGRGSQDNKSGVIAILEAVERLVKEGFQPTRTLWLVFGHDEETDGRNGAGKIAAYLEAKNIKLETVLDEGLFVSEGLFPGLVQPLAPHRCRRRATSQWTYTSKVRAAIPASPRNSSIARMGEFAHRLEQKKIPPVMTAPMRALIQTLAPMMPQPQRFVMNNLNFFESSVASSTIAIYNSSSAGQFHHRDDDGKRWCERQCHPRGGNSYA